jgi:membrane protease YdiL (CAAX protease family)
VQAVLVTLRTSETLAPTLTDKNQLSSSDHVVPEMQIEPPLEPVVSAPAVAINPGAENPPWSGLDLLLVCLVLVLALFLFSSIFFAIVLHSSLGLGVSAAELSKNPGPIVIVPSMTLAYLAMLIAMYLVVTRHRQRPFWQTVGWRWPSNPGWLAYMLGGALLAVGLGELSRLLPIPKSLPMDQFFQNRQGAYLMMIFGVAIAPLAEEMFFRGFLYPVLDRWLQTLLMTPRQVRRGCIWILLTAGWGYIGHRLPLAWSVLLAVVFFLVFGALVVARSLRSRDRAPGLALLPVATVVAWGAASRAISDHAFGIATTVFLLVACLLVILSMLPSLAVSSAGRWGRILAVLATSFAFAMVHSEQLAQAWGPLLVLFVVGLVLTIARVVTRSVTPGLLIHVGYNLMLFSVLYLGTDHFRHLERMTQ